MGKSKNIPQVFINFRGKDERQKLLPHLKHHLKDRNVNVFTDDDAIREPLENLFKHIRRSRIVIVIFSINYLESRWCLDELVEIKKCLECEKVDFAIPIFYKVKTYHVKNQSGKFGKFFVALQEKHRNSRVKRWKKALRYVAKLIGLTYKKRSSVSELEFIKKIVERIDFALTKISSKGNINNYNNNSPETSKGEASNLTDVNHLNKMFHVPTTLEALNLERSYLQGFMFGSAWKDVVNPWMHTISNRFMISDPGNPLRFHINLQRWHVQRNECLEKAINWLALHMMYQQAHPASIFSNWDKLDVYTKNSIRYAAREKTDMLRGYDGDVGSRPFLSTNFSPFVQVPTSYRMLEPKVPQDYRRSISYHNNINQYNLWPDEMDLTPPLEEPHMDDDNEGQQMMCVASNKDPMFYDAESEDQLPIFSRSQYAEDQEHKTSCISLLCYCFKLCFSLTWELKKMTRTSPSAQLAGKSYSHL